jgi:hypothetical protein
MHLLMLVTKQPGRRRDAQLGEQVLGYPRIKRLAARGCDGGREQVL